MNKELKNILEESILKEPIMKGITIFNYQKRILYYETDKEIIELDIHITEEEILKLTQDIASVYNQEFNKSNPSLFIKKDGIKLVAFNIPIVNSFSFYLDIGNASFLKQGV